MKLSSVRPSVRLSVRHIIRPPHAAAAVGQQISIDCCTAGTGAQQHM